MIANLTAAVPTSLDRSQYCRLGKFRCVTAVKFAVSRLLGLPALFARRACVKLRLLSAQRAAASIADS
jgi:hypothetical protein